MSLAQIGVVAEGIANSLMLTEVKRAEDSVGAGRNAHFTACLQTAQAHAAIAYGDRALEVAGAGSIPLLLRSILYITPAVFAVITSARIEDEAQREAAIFGGIEDESLRAVAIFIQDQIGNLYHVIALVSSVVLIYFGQTLFGATSLAVLAIGFLDRQGILPERVRQFVHTVSPPVFFITGALYGDLFSQIISGLDVISYGIGVYLDWREQQILIPPVPESELELEEFLANPPALEINRDYLLWPTHARAIPDIDLQALVDQFQAINWNPENIVALRRKLGEDQRFSQRCGDPARKRDDELIRAAEQQLTNCVTAVKERRILAGEPRSYEKLIEYMKFIAHELPRRPVAEQIDSLMILAIEGGEYCGPGIYDAAEMIYGALIGESQFFTFSSKVLNCLQSARGSIIQGIYAEKVALHRDRRQAPQARDAFMDGMGDWMDWQDRHNIHLFLNIFGGELGLRKAAADNDEIAFDPILKLIMPYYWGEEIRGKFWQRHSLNEIVETVRNALGTPELPKHEMYDWWKEWINRAGISEDEKRARLAELDYAQLFNQDLEEDGKVKREFVRAMLLDMGILRPL